VASKKNVKKPKNQPSKAEIDDSLLKAVNDVLMDYRKENHRMTLRVLAMEMLLERMDL
jgi:hypothetical protein